MQGLDCSAEDKTIIYAKSGMPYTTQTWFYSGDLDQTNIKKYWDDNYHITSVAYTKNGWFVAMSKNSGLTRQAYSYTNDFPKDWIKEKWDEDYYITSISSSRTHRLVVMSKGVGYTDQWYNRGNFDTIKPWYLKKKKEGYYVTAADYTGTEWWIVMSKGSDITVQYSFFASTYSDLKTKIQENVWNKGYNIHLIEYGADGYLVFYGSFKKSNNIACRYSVDPSSPKNSIQQMWDDNKDIVYIGGGYESSRNSSTSTSTTSGHGLPYNGETKYWKRSGYVGWMSLRAFTDSYGEVIYEKYPCGIYMGLSYEVYKKEYNDNGYYVLQKYKRTLVQTGLSQFGNDRYEKLSGTLKVSFDGNKIIDDNGKIYDKVITKEEANQMDKDFQNWVNRMGGTTASPSSGGSYNNSTTNNRCKTCGGSGVCSSCGGRKGSWQDTGYYVGDGSKSWIPCPSCNGSGRCFMCHGSGRF
jgi:hypothetical protein